MNDAKGYLASQYNSTWLPGKAGRGSKGNIIPTLKLNCCIILP